MIKQIKTERVKIQIVHFINSLRIEDDNWNQRRYFYNNDGINVIRIDYVNSGMNIKFELFPLLIVYNDYHIKEYIRKYVKNNKL